MPPVFGVLFDGLAYGMLLFLLSVGLSVTLGMMNFVNLAHCSFAMLGGYVTVTLMNALRLAVLRHAAGCVHRRRGRVSVVLERVFFRRFYRASDLDQCLLTIGIVFVSIAAAAYIYGTDQQPMQLPPICAARSSSPALNFAVYRLFLIAIALADHGRAGRRPSRPRASARRCAPRSTISAWRAGSASMSTACSPSRLRSAAGLPASAARWRSRCVGLDPSFALTYLIYVLIVVSVGGLGSIAGSFAAAMVLGVSDIAGKYYVPAIGAFLIYLVMIVLLMWRPPGLFGRR